MGLTFNDISSDSVGVIVQVYPSHEFPERDYEVTHVPGRNGDIVIDKGSYKNLDRSYQIVSDSKSDYYKRLGGKIEKLGNDIFVDFVERLSAWLHSASGYARLEDDYEPEYYRMAMYSEENSVSNAYGVLGYGTITFNCKPQCFLKSGEEEYSFTSSGTITNPTAQTSLPLITVAKSSSSSGTLTIGDYTITIASGISNIIIDSEIQDAYYGSANRNSYITLDDDEFPVLESGSNSISFSDDITSVIIVPRWWTL